LNTINELIIRITISTYITNLHRTQDTKQNVQETNDC